MECGSDEQCQHVVNEIQPDTGSGSEGGWVWCRMGV